MSSISSNSHTSTWDSQFGRSRNLQLCTVFAVDKNRKLLLTNEEYKDKQGEYEGGIDVVSLDVTNNLKTQWCDLSVKPDLVVSKMHNALGSIEDEVHSTSMHHYDGLAQSDQSSEFKKLNIIPIECEYVLHDRYKMAEFLKRIARVVNLVGNTEAIGCSTPQWLTYSKSNPAKSSDLPPFPIVVKPKSTAIKMMGVVFDVNGLKNFCDKSECNDFSLEQYIPHSGVVYKIYVIARHIFVGSRPSLPDIGTPTPQVLSEFATEIKGEYISGSESEGLGYVTFLSNVITNRAGNIEAKRITDPDLNLPDLHAAIVDTFRMAIELEWNIELFGFDVLVDKDNQTHYVVDCNALPGYKGVPNFLGHMNKLFIRHGIRKGLQEDIARVNRDDDAIRSFCIEKMAAWKEGGVKVEDLMVRRLVDSRIFQVKCRKDARRDLAVRKTLVAFYNWEKPRRIIHDEINFIGNVAQGLFDAGLGPDQYCDIHAKYYGCDRYLGRLEEWVEGMTLLKALKKPTTQRGKMFSCLGTSIARFHKAIENEQFKKDVLDHHFQKLEGVPLCYSLLEIWRRCSIISVEKSELKNSPMWGGFCGEFMETATTFEEVKKQVHVKLRSKYSMKTVYSHFDVNLSNAIVDNNCDPSKVTLIDIEWSGPSLAVYDFAKLISSLELQIERQEIDITMETVKEMLTNVVEAYLCEIGAFEGASEEERGAEVSDFLSDCWAFVPIACILNVYSNLIHASFDGQLTDISENRVLGKRGENFNWLRHASDHYAGFKKHFTKLNTMPRNG